jgi:hypothetical protein
VLAIGALSFWLNSLDSMLAEKKWTFPFCENLVWVILLPTQFMYCVRRGFAKHPDTSPFTQIPGCDPPVPSTPHSSADNIKPGDDIRVSADNLAS